MTHADFEKFLDARLAKIKAMLSIKAKEYATEGDRLHNFKRSAGIRGGRTPAQVCLDFMTKHLTSVFDLVDTDSTVPPAFLDEKFGDVVNYFILLEALLLESQCPSK